MLRVGMQIGDSDGRHAFVFRQPVIQRVFGWADLRRRNINAALIVIRVSYVENLERPSN